MDNKQWYQEEWATDLFADIAKSVFAPKTKEPAPVSPQTGGSLGALGASFADWVIPVSIVASIVVILLFVFLFLKGG